MDATVTRIDQAEGWMVQYMADLLDISEEDVDVTQPFDQLGLDSAASVAFTSDLGKWLGIQLETSLMIENDTIQSVSQFLRRTHGQPA